MKVTGNTKIYLTDCNLEKRISFCNVKKRKRRERVEEELQFDEETGELIPSKRHLKSLADSERRARVAVVDLALCNKFEYFGTITFDDRKIDCKDYFLCLRKITMYFNNYSKRSDNFEYILVPELGEETYRFHFHFLVKGILKDDLFINEHRHLDWHLISDNFGHCQITKIEDTDGDRRRVAYYCSKYITKGNLKLLNHRYFCSKSLQRSKKSVIGGCELVFSIKDWLELNGYYAYCDKSYVQSFAIPEFVWKFLKAYIDKCIFDSKNWIKWYLDRDFEIIDDDYNPFERGKQCQINLG